MYVNMLYSKYIYIDILYEVYIIFYAPKKKSNFVKF